MDRFWSKTSLAPSGCLVWTAGRFKDGYGGFKRHGTMQRAHRVAWEIFHGAISNGLHVLHRCDNQLCVNPDHLFLGTHDDNMKDMTKKGRNAFGEAHHQAKLTKADIATIRNSPASAEDLAPQYNVTWRTIYHIRSGHTWKDA